MEDKDLIYDIALSFAGEDRVYVHEVADLLKAAGYSVFYDEYEAASLWGKDLYTHLDWVYRLASRYCVIFISSHYAGKMWTNHERAAAQARAIKENQEYVLPVRFDDTDIDGVLPTVGYIDISDKTPTELVDLTREKLGPKPAREYFPDQPTRLYDFFDVEESNEEGRDKLFWVAYSFFKALQRMNLTERKAVCALLAFGCPGELPDFVHISLDLLHRMTGISKPDLLSALADVRSLNITVKSRDPVHGYEDGELISDDQDLTLSFWSEHEEEEDISTVVGKAVVDLATDHYCEDHGLEFVVKLDFSRLATID